jgi:hypothetical protein
MYVIDDHLPKRRSRDKHAATLRCNRATHSPPSNRPVGYDLSLIDVYHIITSVDEKLRTWMA